MSLATMPISRVYLCLIFLTFLTSPPVLCSRSPRLAEASSAAIEKKLEREEHVRSPALLVSVPIKAVDSSSSMTKIGDESATQTSISGFFKHKFPFQGWPFHKYGPFPNGKPANPSSPATRSSGAEAEESEKVPSSPNNGNREGGSP